MNEWTALSQFLLNALCFAAIGCVLGILCRTRTLLALLLSVPVSIGGLMLGAWWAGTFSNQFSLQDPGGTVYWLGVPYLLICLFAFLLSSDCRSSIVRHDHMALSYE